MNALHTPRCTGRQSIFRLLFAFVLLCCGSGNSWSLQALFTDHDGALGPQQMRYWIEAGQPPITTPDDIDLDRVPWQAVDNVPVNLGFRKEAAWFHLRLHNDTNRLQQPYLEITYPLLDDVRIYVIQQGTLVENSTFGDEFPFDNRPVDHPTFLNRLQVDSGQTLDILVRVKTISSLQLPIFLWQPDTLLSGSASDLLLNGLYYGTLLVLLVYNLFAYANGREKKYLYYALYITSIGMFFACMNGFGFQYLWPDAPGLTKTMIVLSLATTIMFAALFTRDFLALPDSRPWLNLATQGLFVAGIGFAVACLVLPYSLLIKPLIATVMVAASCALLAGMVRWYDGHPAAFLFCGAWLMLYMGGVAMAANKLGWIPRTQFTEHTAQLGSMLEFILLSLGLVRQIHIERGAKSEAQRTALEFERQANYSRQQALLVQQEAARELEQRVRRRTLELQIANEKLSALSVTDALTGLKNRRFFNERLVAEFTRSKRDGTPISVIIIDVDHFKPINDTHGHLLGDEVLKLVAAQIETEAKRQSDIVTRHGGEEFSAVLINNSAAEALSMAERIRARVASAPYQAEGISLSCTVSVGVATMTPSKHSSPEELIQQADEALYQSKSGGRNRVTVFCQQAA